MSTRITISRRFNGPPEAGNGGHTCGLLADDIDGAVEVTQRQVKTSERCVVIGWKVGCEGRKHDTGTAILSEAGELHAVARARWIEVATEL